MRKVYAPASIFLALLPFFAPAANAQAKIGGPEQTLLQLANRDRTAQRLPPLRWSLSLAEAANQHALLMAQHNALSHQFPAETALAARASRAGARFSTIAENVALGPNPDGIHQQWMNSPPHRANLLDPKLNSVGIAVVERNGTFFAVEDFSLGAPELSIQDQEAMVASLLQAHGLELLDYTSDARRSCAMDKGYAGSHTPSFVLHYATPDLQTLPDMLEQRIQTGKYHSAAVGACASNEKFGFTSYRVAVLLFE